MSSRPKPPHASLAAHLYTLLCVCAGIVGPASPVLGASEWQVQDNPQLFATAATVPGPTGNSVSFSCTRPGAPSHTQSGIALRPPIPNQMVFSVDPAQIGADTVENSQTPVTLIVDGKVIGTLPLVLALPEERLSAMVTYDHALLSMFRKAAAMELRNPKNNRSVAVSLAGLSAALDEVISRCQTPLTQAAATKMQAAAEVQSTTGATASKAALTGTPVPVQGQIWYGKAECPRVKDAEAELVITGRNQQQQYEASLTIVTEQSLQNGSLKLALLGEDEKDGGIRFVLGQRPGLGIGFQPPKGMVFVPASGEAKLDGGSCSSLSVAPLDAQSPRLLSTVPPPGNGGTFYAAVSVRDKCEAIVAWAGRLNDEYPDIDFYRTSNTTDLAWKMIRIFGDEDFVPVFGKPYDVLPYEERVEVRNFVESECGRDPFVRDRLETYRAAVSRTITGGSKTQELTSNGYTASVFAVRKMRALRNEILLVERGGSGDASSLRKTMDSLSGKLELLWPSERAAMEARLEKAISEEASAKATQIVTSALSNTDPAAAVPAADQAIARLNSELGGVLSTPELGRAADTLKAHRQAAVEKILGPALLAIKRTEVSLDGAKALAGQIKSPDNNLSVLSAAELNTYKDEVRRELDGVLKKLVSARTAVLDPLPDTREGLASSAIWISEYERDLKAFEDSTAYAEGYAAFLRRREEMLVAALPEFQAEMEAAGNQVQRDTVVKSYLGWPGDESLPVYLEYELVRMSLTP